MSESQKDNHTQSDGSQYYIPSSIEKKRAVTMYVLSWIIMIAWKNEINQFELFHLKQSLGRWSCFLLMFIVSLVLLFVPYIKILALLLVFSMVVVLSIFIKQARDWKYNYDTTNKLSIFQWIWWWILNLFEKEIDAKEKSN